MPKQCANLQKILRGPNQFKPEFTMCIPGMFVSVAFKGLLDLEVYLETIQCLRREPAKITNFCLQQHSKTK